MDRGKSVAMVAGDADPRIRGCQIPHHQFSCSQNVRYGVVTTKDLPQSTKGQLA
jgi:hypothetical protein